MVRPESEPDEGKDPKGRVAEKELRYAVRCSVCRVRLSRHQHKADANDAAERHETLTALFPVQHRARVEDL